MKRFYPIIFIFLIVCSLGASGVLNCDSLVPGIDEDEDNDSNENLIPFIVANTAAYTSNNPTIPNGLSLEEVDGNEAACTFPPTCFAYISVTISNSSGSDIDFTFEAGYVFIPGSNDVQPMMVAQDTVVTVPANSTGTDFCIPTYCLDSGVSAPGDTDQFQLSAIATKSCLLEIITILENKQIDSTAAYQIQFIIWDCVENGSITADNISYLESLPDL